jgi:alpha-N-arabinofuranosidase
MTDGDGTTWRAGLALDPDLALAPVNPLVFGSFVEHMGRGVYTGIFEPGHPRADRHGFRVDVLDLVRELGVTAVRYPGGNFVSGYRWEDGVGPIEERPTRRDRAWKSIEPNHFGLGEFMYWTEKAGVEPIVALNLGTRGTREAVELLTYANFSDAGAFSDLRRRHGHAEPYDIRTWCLGNEIDGPWQLGHKPADEYGRLAEATARAMREVDPGLRLVLCGSSGISMPTFGSWDRTVLEHAFDQTDLISAHAYYDPEAMAAEEFLASAVEMGQQISSVIEIADEVARLRGSSKRIGIAFDEWNVWYMGRHNAAPVDDEWCHAPRLCEDNYTVSDAIVVGSLLMTLVRNSDRVGIACQAQLVNTIAPIRAEPRGSSWRQTTFYPFSMIARHARGLVLDVVVDGEQIESGRRGAVPAVDGVATFDPNSRATTLFVVNRSRQHRSAVTVDLERLGPATVIELLILADDDPGAANTEPSPERVHPRSGSWEYSNETVTIALPPVSFAMLRLGPA